MLDKRGLDNRGCNVYNRVKVLLVDDLNFDLETYLSIGYSNPPQGETIGIN